MAAGLGSRFGAGEGQKQVTPVDENGHLIIDYSVYDAYVSGFEKVVFVIKPESKEKFHALIGANVSKHMEVAYAFQTLESCLPEGFKVPEGRVKRSAPRARWRTDSCASMQTISMGAAPLRRRPASWTRPIPRTATRW